LGGEVFLIARTIKKPEVRRTELMDAALELFSAVGYQKTMIIDITQKAGVAKGTFYHYYLSKEAILTAICHRGAMELVASFDRESRQLPALSKLQQFMARLFSPQQRENVLYRQLWEEGQLNLYYETWRSTVDVVFNPQLAAIIEQGQKEGTMQVDCPEQAIAFFWSILHCVWEAVFFQEPAALVAGKTKMAQSLLAYILGIEKNTLLLSLTGC
jgi:AcrR family transcriptional regulator